MIGRIYFLAAILPLLVTLVGTAGAATLTVPSQYESIVAALEVAEAGDRIELQPGTYYESGLIMTQPVDLIGVGTSAEDVIIDGGDNDRILLCQNVDGKPTIAKITFAHGQATGSSNLGATGGAILFDNSDAAVRDCAFLDNLALGCGGAIRCVFSSPSFMSCYLADNDAPDGGGGAIDASYDSSPTVQDCSFVHNSAGWGAGIACRGAANPDISGCTFQFQFRHRRAGLRRAGVFADFSSNPKLTGCTFVSNYAHFGWRPGEFFRFADRSVALHVVRQHRRLQWSRPVLLRIGPEHRIHPDRRSRRYGRRRYGGRQPDPVQFESLRELSGATGPV